MLCVVVIVITASGDLVTKGALSCLFVPAAVLLQCGAPGDGPEHAGRPGAQPGHSRHSGGNNDAFGFPYLHFDGLSCVSLVFSVELTSRHRLMLGELLA